MRFLALSAKAPMYYRELEQRRLNAHQHLVKIVALSDIYGVEQVARAIEDAVTIQAFSSEYIANILEQRTRRLPEPGPLIVTRRQDLLEIEIAPPDLSIYDRTPNPAPGGSL
jgi:hypothetical protein